MAPTPGRTRGIFRSKLGLRLLAAGLLSSAGLAPALAQAPTNVSGLPYPVPTLPAKDPRPAEVGAAIEPISSNDGVIEVVVGQSRLITFKDDLQKRDKGAAEIHVSDPSVANFTIVQPPTPDPKMPRPARQVRVIGQRIGVTDLVVTTPDEKTYSFEVRVLADLDVLRVQLRALFPDAALRLSQVRDHLIVEGQARNSAQVARIMETIRAYLTSVQTGQVRTIGGQPGGGRLGEGPKPGEERPGEERPGAAPGQTGPTSIEAAVGGPRVVNLIRVPTSQQVLLKVRIAELNRTALREIGADFLAFDKSSGTVVGSGLGSSSINASGTFAGTSFTTSALSSALPGKTTVFAIFDKGNFDVMLNALRRNQLLKILAEPNLVALNGQRANFLAGGQFFIPTAQTGVGGGVGGGAISAQPVDFGVRLDFLAHILDDDVIRLTVDPEVSRPDFTVATTLVAGGSPVPGLNKRSTHTTVELKQGQTLAIAGLMSVTLDGTSNRLPGLGDLPILGPLFSNTSSTRVEQELLILVTPYLVEPMNPDQVPPTPGDEVNAPNDLEFYLLNRLEGRTGKDFRATTEYDDALHVLRRYLRLHEHHVRGPHGYCD